MVRRALFLVIFVVVAAALVADYGGGEQRPEGGGGQDEAGGEAGGSAGSRSSGDFAFVGFYAEIVNWVVPDCPWCRTGRSWRLSRSRTTRSCHRGRRSRRRKMPTP